MRLLPGSDQERLGRVSPERTTGRGLIQEIQASYCDGEPLTQGICGVKGGAGLLAGGEGGRLAGLSGHLGWGGASAPADRIRRTAEVPPTVVGLHAMRPSGHRNGLSGGKGWVAGHLPTGPLSGGHVSDTQEGDHRSAGQTDWDRPPQPNSDIRSKLDGALRHHGTPGRGTPWDGQIQVRRPCPPDGGGEGGDPTATCRGDGDRSGRGP